MQEPSTSENVESSNPESSSLRKDDDMKNSLTNALIYCKNLLEAENLLTDTLPVIFAYKTITHYIEQ